MIESIRSSKLVKYLKENFVCIVRQEDIQIDIENNESSVFIWTYLTFLFFFYFDIFWCYFSSILNRYRCQYFKTNIVISVSRSVPQMQVDNIPDPQPNLKHCDPYYVNIWRLLQKCCNEILDVGGGLSCTFNILLCSCCTNPFLTRYYIYILAMCFIHKLFLPFFSPTGCPRVEHI